LQTLGSNAFLPSDEVSSTFQISDDLTKIYGKHTFKMGFEWQHVKFSTLQPPWSRGQFNFDVSSTTRRWQVAGGAAVDQGTPASPTPGNTRPRRQHRGPGEYGAP
jgi:hypothetical protein